MSPRSTLLSIAGALMLCATHPVQAAAGAAPKPATEEKPAMKDPKARPYTMNVAIMMYDGMEILDFAGPAEVFAAAAGFGANGLEPAFHVYTVSKTKAPVVSQGFIDIVPDHALEDSPRPDIIVLPGGGTQKVLEDPAWLAWIERAAADADQLLTVCTGAFIAGKLGLLDGLEATTWYGALPRMAAAFPKTKVHPGRRFVDNGKVVTTAGVSAGIDGSLHLVARLLGEYVAMRTAEYMEYRWSPESYQSSRYPLLNPRLDARGRSMQQVSIAMHEGDLETAVSISRSLIAANRGDGEAWLSLGEGLKGLKRDKEALEAYHEAARVDGLRGQALFGQACVYARTGERDRAIEAAAKAIEAGQRQKWRYEQAEDLTSIREDARFKAMLAGL